MFSDNFIHGKVTIQINFDILGECKSNVLIKGRYRSSSVFTKSRGTLEAVLLRKVALTNPCTLIRVFFAAVIDHGA